MFRLFLIRYGRDLLLKCFESGCHLFEVMVLMLSVWWTFSWQIEGTEARGVACYVCGDDSSSVFSRLRRVFLWVLNDVRVRNRWILWLVVSHVLVRCRPVSQAGIVTSKPGIRVSCQPVQTLRCLMTIAPTHAHRKQKSIRAETNIAGLPAPLSPITRSIGLGRSPKASTSSLPSLSINC
jgi:hypothetical protein